MKVGVLTICVAAGLVGVAAFSEDDGLRRPGFRFGAVNEQSLGLWEGDRPVLRYNHGPISGPDSPARASYVHPIYGLDGEVLTDDFPKDHVYHRGLYWAWPHVKIGDEPEVDLWILRGIRIQFEKWLKREAKAGSATLAVRNGWYAGDKLVAREEVRLKAHRATDSGRWMEIELKWTPLDRPITLRGAEGKSYGGLTLRFGPRTTTVITTPRGPDPEDGLDAKHAWADLSGDFAGPGRMSGITVFPEEGPDAPHSWMTRHYGLLAVGWPGVSARTFPPGRTFTHRAAFWIHRNNPAAPAIQSAYDSFRRKRGRI